MIAVLLSAILFGMVHPGSKLIMQQQIELLPFCLLYVGIRLLFQVPIVIREKAWLIRGKAQFLCLLSLGIIGALLQISEFYGISAGLPVATVTFLVYTHPVWTLLLSRVINGEKISLLSISKIAFALVGILLITGCQFSSGYKLSSFIVPICAGLMIALWITVSNRAAKQGCSTKMISFYYDLFCFFILLALCVASQDSHLASQAIEFCKAPKKLIQVTFYSVFIGLLPNYFFYYGSKTISAVTAGLILLLEPVISSAIAALIWHEPVSPWFIAGAVAILSTNLPLAGISRQLTPVVARLRSVLPRGEFMPFFIIGLWALLGIPEARSAVRSTLHIVEIVPVDPTDYTLDAELRLIKFASDRAVNEYRKIDQQCSPRIERIIKRGSEEELFTTIGKISRSSSSDIVIGFTRSNSARIAAKAAAGSKLRGISIGASAANLREINSNFISICSPWTRQAEAIFTAMKKGRCTPENTSVVYDPRNYLSSKFADAYKIQDPTVILNTHSKESLKTLPKLILGKSCIFMPMQFSDSQAYLREIEGEKWVGSVFGIGDWNYYPDELRKSLGSAKYEGLTVVVPTGWIPNVSARSQRFSKAIKNELKQTPSPAAAYVFDATILALEAVCRNFDPTQYQAKKMAKLPLLRNYENISNTGNYLGPIFTVSFRSGGYRESINQP